MRELRLHEGLELECCKEPRQAPFFLFWALSPASAFLWVSASLFSLSVDQICLPYAHRRRQLPENVRWSFSSYMFYIL